ncbi:slipin family protein [Sphaerochaeta halotolerans]|uniref:Slipin family protein n=1 Tax=Sphaerochaeta halotolerans TaxID=2293840 RepID=A0A372MJE2_9SPIR|nr:slipin family protein [Sphaerochaeta halotolerans]RFU95563.1 slipin family protein [Sphaerochaeta halotolerans]
MNLYKKKIERIKNMKGFVLKKDFNYGALSFLVLALFLAGGAILQLLLYPNMPHDAIVMVSTIAFTAAIIIAIFPLWTLVMAIILILWVWIIGELSPYLYPITAFSSLGLLISSSFQLVYHWDKVIVLRLGKFQKVRGPGLFFLLPLIDRAAEFIDTRIRATDFSAEKTLTKDTVPVHVDALAFWMIWDAKKAILEVEDYTEAVILSAQTALRDSIGKHYLRSLLSEREELGREIQQALDTKTNPWGVTILSIEITDIIIPKELEDALSKQAQAEREKESRIILGAAEVEIAKKFTEASAEYANDPIALQLRSMNMVYEGIRQNNSMMLMPASILDHMDFGAVMGTAAMQKGEQAKRDSEKEVAQDEHNQN